MKRLFLCCVGRPIKPAFCLISILILFSYVHAAEDQSKKVLLLNSYAYDMKWTRAITEAITEVFEERPDIEIFIEFMDTKRHFSPAHYENLLTLYKRKYSKMGLDVIITSDDNGSRFALQHRSMLFPDVPIVFCGVNDTDFPKKDDFKNITGVLEVAGFKETIDLAITLFPRTAHLFLINESATMGSGDRKQIQKILGSFSDRFNCTWLEDKSEQEMLSSLEQMPKESVVLLLSFFGNKGEYTYSIPEGANFICKNSRSPVFSMWEYLLNEGIIGGQLTSGRYQGINAARMAMKIIDGRDIERISLLSTSANQFMFDYNQLRRFDIAPSRLPADAIVINRPPSLFKEFKKEIITVSVVMALMFVLIVFLLISIRARKIVENNLRESRKLLRTVIEAIPDMIWLKDPDGMFLACNPTFERFFGQKEKNIVGKTDYDFVDTELADLFRENDLAAVKRGSARVNEEMVTFAEDGYQAILETIKTPMFNADGKLMGVLGIARDITDRKEHFARFRRVMDSFDAIVYVADMESYEVLFMNKYGRDLLGDVSGTMCWQTLQQDQKGPCPFCTNDKLIDEHGKPTGPVIWEIKNTLTNEWYECRDQAITWLDGKVVRMEIATNITLRKEAEKQKKTLEEKLRQSHKMEAIGTLAGGVAHDFNNILGIIIGQTELALNIISEWEPARHNLKEIKTAGLRGKEVVHQLLSFSRKSEHKKKPLRASPIIKESIKLIRSTIPVSIDIETHIDDGVASINADPTQIQQVVLNLCTNAAHAMENKGGVLKITLTQKRIERPKDELLPGEYLRLAVSDDGIGIHPDIRDKIFDPYFTTKDVSKGSGLGLAIVLGIVKNHDGHIFLENRHESGTTVTVYLPICKEDALEQQVEPDLLHRGNATILYVDDEKSILEPTTQLLQGLGYHVESDHNPVEAVKIFKSDPKRFDLVITDMTMPCMNGLDLLKALRAIRSDIPVIICTGNSGLIGQETVKKFDISCILIKPLLLSEFAQAIGQISAKDTV